MKHSSIYTVSVPLQGSFPEISSGVPLRYLLSRILYFLKSGFSGKSSYEETRQRFESLLKAHSDLISRICFSYATDGEDYKDLYQNVLINIWKGLANFRGESASSTWLYRVTLNTCVSTLRKRKSRPATQSLDSSPADFADESGDDERRERLEWLHRMISELSPVDKAIVTMWLDDRSYNEIAEVVGLTPNTIGIRLHRIRTAWRKKGLELKND